MKKLIIIGAGGFGREVLVWSRQIPQHARDWELFGFIDDNPKALDGFQIDLKIIGAVTDFEPQEDFLFTCAIGDPKIKMNICESLRRKGALFTNIIHPTAIVGANCRLGTGIILCPRSILTTNVTVGDFVTINLHSTVGHDATLEAGCTLSGHCSINGAAYLEEGVFMGSHVVVLPSVRIAQYTKVGACSNVLKHVKKTCVVYGNPARQIF